MCCHEKVLQMQALAVFPGARYDLIPLELSPWVRAWGGVIALPSLLVTGQLLGCPLCCPVLSHVAPLSLASPRPYFLLSLLPQWLIILLSVLAQDLPDTAVFCAASLWVLA